MIKLVCNSRNIQRNQYRVSLGFILSWGI